MVAESVLVKHQLLILNRGRKRAPNLRAADRILAGLCTLVMRPARVVHSAIVLKPSTFLYLHNLLKKRKYHMLFSPKGGRRPGPKGLPGVKVENKLYTASIHFRRASHDRVEEIREIAQSEISSAGLFQLADGLKILDIRPRVKWNKGSSVHWIKERVGKGDSLPLYIGDDATDEDAFRALADAITVKERKAFSAPLRARSKLAHSSHSCKCISSQRESSSAMPSASRRDSRSIARSCPLPFIARLP